MFQAPTVAASRKVSFVSLLFSRELRWLTRQARPYLHIQLASAVCITASSWLYLLDPLVMKWLLDYALPKRDWHGLFLALSLILSIYLGRAILNSAGSLLTVKATQKLILDLRTRLLRHLNRLSADYHETQSVGHRFYIFKDPMEEMAQLGTDLLPSILRTTVLIVLVFGTMLVLNPHLTLAVLPVAPIFLAARHHFRSRLRSQADSLQDKQKEISSFLQEHLHSITQIQLLAAEKRQEKRTFHLFAEILRAQCRLWRTATEFTAVSSLVTALGVVTVLGVGGNEFFAGRLTIGGLVAFYTYLTRLFEPLSEAVGLYSRIQRVSASVFRVMGTFELEPVIKEKLRPFVVEKGTPGEISFDQVSFGYPSGKLILTELNFCIPPGGRVALVGANGSGKSTTGKLIARLYDPCSGVVRIDGVDIRGLRLKNLRELVCYLPQHAVLFDADLRQNILLGNPSALEDEVAVALAMADLRHIVSKLRGGLRGFIGPGGNQLSGGERQRVAIARAILQKPAILILDEATSFLDGQTEDRILSRLCEYLCHTTIVMISHHPSALRQMKQIFVLQAGNIVAHGSQMHLSQTNDAFAELLRGRSTSSESTLVVERLPGALGSV